MYSVFLALTAIQGLDIWASDVYQAFLQSAEPIARDFCTKNPVSEFDCDPSQCLRFLKQLFDLCESGDL